MFMKTVDNIAIILIVEKKNLPIKVSSGPNSLPKQTSRSVPATQT